MAVAVIVVASPACGQVSSHPPAIVTRYCSGCHGLDGASQAPYLPRIAGIGAPYLATKWATYKSAGPAPVDEAFSRMVHIGKHRNRATLVAVATEQMIGVAHAASDEDSKEAIRWYSAQQPAPGKSGTSKTIEEGKSLYINGLRSQGLYACQICHGPEARGNDSIPRLAGQNAPYVLAQLALFRAGGRPNSPMTEIARHLRGDQARAIAGYLQSR